MAHIVVLLAITPLLAVGNAWTIDEGLYARQAQQLVDGSWEYNWTGIEIDPTRQTLPYVNVDRKGDPTFLYVRHPLWPSTIAATFKLAGDRYGPLLILLPSLVVLSIGTYLLARELVPSATRWAYVLSAFAPAAVNGWIWWAHAPSAALAALAWWAGIRALRKRFGLVEQVTLFASIFVGCLLRTEMLLFAMALAAMLAGFAVFKRLKTTAFAAGWVVGASLAALAVERAWTKSIVGVPLDSLASRSTGSWIAGRFSGASHILLRASADTAASVVLVLVVVAAALACSVAVRCQRASYALIGLTGIAVVFTLNSSSNYTEPITGLLPAWPICAIGIAVGIGSMITWRTNEFLACGTVSALFVGAVLLTQYSEGGGLEWGGRFLVPMTPILACAAAPGLSKLLALVRTRPIGVVMMAMLVVVPFGAGVVSTTWGRTVHRDMVDQVSDANAEVVIVQPSVFALSTWRLDRDGRKIFLARTVEEYVRLSEALRNSGVTEILVVQVNDLNYLEGCLVTDSLGGVDLTLYRVTLSDSSCGATFTGVVP
jgi:hypothetical protein